MIDIELLKTILNGHRGIGNSIKRKELRGELGLCLAEDRTLRLIIGELRRTWKPILFCTSTGRGKRADYYLPATYQELQQGIEQMKSYIIEECQVLHFFKRKGHQYLAGDQEVRMF